jgi:transcriptional regulator with XRE-family HTH domain
MASRSTEKQNPLRGARQARGWTLGQVAAQAQIDKGHLSRAERGQAGLSVDALHRLAITLELPELARLLGPFRTATTEGGEASEINGPTGHRDRRTQSVERQGPGK